MFWLDLARSDFAARTRRARDVHQPRAPPRAPLVSLFYYELERERFLARRSASVLGPAARARCARGAPSRPASAAAAAALRLHARGLVRVPARAGEQLPHALVLRPRARVPGARGAADARDALEHVVEGHACVGRASGTRDVPERIWGARPPPAGTSACSRTSNARCACSPRSRPFRAPPLGAWAAPPRSRLRGHRARVRPADRRRSAVLPVNVSDAHWRELRALPRSTSDPPPRSARTGDRRGRQVRAARARAGAPGIDGVLRHETNAPRARTRARLAAVEGGEPAPARPAARRRRPRHLGHGGAASSASALLEEGVSV